MAEDYQELIKRNVLDQDALVRATFSGSMPGRTVPWIKVVVRPVLLKSERFLQFSYFDGKKDISKNYAGAEAEAKLGELLALPFRNFHVETRARTIQINLSSKGKPLIRESRRQEQQQKQVTLQHDKDKNLIVHGDKPEPFLQAVGIMTSEGKIKSDMQSKYRQINEYLKLVDQTGALLELGSSPVRVVDFGCGNAYLTFATYHYLTNVLRLDTRMVGIDVQSDLLEKHATNAESLGWDNLTFETLRIGDYKPERPPDVVLALHACDTATDDAIAQGILWQSKLIVTAPCCHHELQEQMRNAACPTPFAAVARHGILNERLGDILTDTFRALVLRIMGYRTDVVQFVSSEHTAKNLMIRAVSGLRHGDPKFVREYNELKQFWQVTPYLERLLGDPFISLLGNTAPTEPKLAGIVQP